MPLIASISGRNPKNNSLLSALSREDFAAVISQSEIISLKPAKRLHREAGAVGHVYFPLDCMIAIVVGSEPEVEIATVGHEGMVGAFGACSAGRAIGTTVVQTEGSAVRVEAAALREESAKRPALDR